MSAPGSEGPPIPGVRDRLTMSCDIETRRMEPARQLAWHADCVYPESCTCPRHVRDDRKAAR